MPERIEQLSLAALRMAASVPSMDSGVVAQWLYRFGTLPRGPAIERDFGPDDDPMAVLGLTVGGAARRRLEAEYEATSFAGWYSFARLPLQLQFEPACKLYVSPRPEALAEAFPRIVDVLARSNVRSFKVGRGIEGLLRPDKLVAYFDGHDHLDTVARELDRVLLGCPAQGVPFTTGLAGNGLLSAGVDPPASETPVSWRSWITKRLAASLTTHRASPLGNVANAVLADMRAMGVDPVRWHANPDAFVEGCLA